MKQGAGGQLYQAILYSIAIQQCLGYHYLSISQPVMANTGSASMGCVTGLFYFRVNFGTGAFI
ncbi:MAG: hypothetical protein GX654_16340 [Desulfatiglans sp.]|nr:hypothetical protein [Desulfatiglans sp.]